MTHREPRDDDRLPVIVGPGQAVLTRMAQWGSGAPWKAYRVEHIHEQERYIEIVLMNPDDAADQVVLRFERP